MESGAVSPGELLAGGACDPAEQAVLLFEGEDGAAAERFAASGPYVAQGPVERWSVSRWNLVVGPLAASPI